MNELEARVKKLEEELARLKKSDRYTFDSKIMLLNGRDIIVGNETGTKIATEATQKLGFWGKAPIAQVQFQTGVGKTVDNLITALQDYGLFRQ